ncbi:MAG: nuclear transport factor 2 family protein [Candidatus Latescibacteria bacterium]|nr:nuclear transport factor 2 family protein [Candidatus Latescibacterota bacterium]
MNARQTVEAYFAALTTGDADRLIDLISSADHFVKIGTEPGEYIEGGGRAVQYYYHHVASTRDFTIDIEHLDVQERDSVAWFYTRQQWRLKWQGQDEDLSLRLTGVLEREAGKWKFAQIHASIGVA